MLIQNSAYPINSYNTHILPLLWITFNKAWHSFPDYSTIRAHEANSRGQDGASATPPPILIFALELRHTREGAVEDGLGEGVQILGGFGLGLMQHADFLGKGIEVCDDLFLLGNGRERDFYVSQKIYRNSLLSSCSCHVSFSLLSEARIPDNNKYPFRQNFTSRSNHMKLG